MRKTMLNLTMSSAENMHSLLKDNKMYRETIRCLKTQLESSKKGRKNARLDFRDMKLDKKTLELILALVGKIQDLGEKCECLEDELEGRILNEKEALARLQELEQESRVQLRNQGNQIKEGKKTVANLKSELKTVQKTVAQRGWEINKLKRELQQEKNINEELLVDNENLKMDLLEQDATEEKLLNMEEELEAAKQTAVKRLSDEQKAKRVVQMLNIKVKELRIENHELKSLSRERKKPNTKMPIRQAADDNIVSEFGSVSQRSDNGSGSDTDVDQEQMEIRDPEWNPSRGKRKCKIVPTQSLADVGIIPRKSARLMARQALLVI
ncbi:unnamed protein product [Orchesella dallaii]|uniref:Uncharacterized protein n=1 Tax=Orchesella dallaii TaxID=48710 RepID=A0ABP1RN76_9HEXA